MVGSAVVAADDVCMMTLMLATLGWCLVSVVAGAGWAAVMAGARKGELRHRPSLSSDVALSEAALPAAGLVPAPRTAGADAVVAA